MTHSDFCKLTEALAITNNLYIQTSAECCLDAGAALGQMMIALSVEQDSEIEPEMRALTMGLEMLDESIGKKPPAPSETPA